MADKTIGLVLAGGGARGFAHLGVLKALAEQGIKPDMISAVSAGSIVGAFIASGMEAEEVMEIMQESDIFDYAKVNLPVQGLMSLDNLKENLNEHLPARKFSDLERPLYVAASNLYKGQIKYFDSGDLVEVVQASSAIPVLFTPVEIEGDLYVDGGLIDNLPVEPLIGKCDVIIAVNVMPLEEVTELDNLMDIALRTFQLSINSDYSRVKSQADLFIEPEGLEEYHILDTKYAKEIFQLGYEHCTKLDLNLADL